MHCGISMTMSDLRAVSIANQALATQKNKYKQLKIEMPVAIL